MAFPQVESITHTGISTAASAQDIDMPSSVAEDNLLLMMLAYDGSGSAPTTPTGWTGLINSNSNSSGRMLVYKQAAGDEGGTSVSVTLGATAACAATVYEISGWNDLEYEDGIGNPTYTVDSSPNPPSLSPSWGAADTLWIAGVMAVDDNGTFNTAPSNYTNLEQIAAGAAVNASAEVGSARRERNIATEDPGTFSMSEIEGWVAVTIAIEPGALGGSGGGTNILAADGVSSASTIAPASIGQLNGLNAASIESGSDASTVAVGQRHGLSAVAVDSTSDISAPGIGQSFVLVGDGAVSLSSISIPGLLQSHLLAAADVVSLPEISIPSVAQRHDLYADDSAALSEVSVPTLTEGSHLLSADDVSSSVLIGVPGIGQVQVLMPLAVQSLSALDQPSLGSGVGLYADGVEAASVITAPGLGQEYVLSLDGVSAASQVDAPDLQQWHVLLGDSVSVLSSIGPVALGDGSESVPTMEIQLRACRSVVARATTSVTVTH
jgi:hypothetical protein